MMGSSALWCLARVTAPSTSLPPRSAHSRGVRARHMDGEALEFEQLAFIFGHRHGDHAFFQAAHLHFGGDGGCCRGIGPTTGKTLGHLAEQTLFFHVATGRRGRSHRLEFIHGIAVRLGFEVGVEFRLYEWTWVVERLIQIHREGNGPSRDKREFHVAPVLLRLILYNGPALQIGRLVLVQDESIGGFPDRGLRQVGDTDLAAAGAIEGNRDRLLLGIVICCECGQRLLQFSIQGGIGEFDALHVRQRE